MNDRQALSIDAMADQVNIGAAVPLLSEGVPGPVTYAGQWWAVPTADNAYRQVTDSAVVQQLDHQAARLAQAAATWRTRLTEDGPQ